MLGNNSMKQTLIGRLKNVLKCEKNANVETSGHFLDVTTNVNIPTSEMGVSHSLKYNRSTLANTWNTIEGRLQKKKEKKHTKKVQPKQVIIYKVSKCCLAYRWNGIKTIIMILKKETATSGSMNRQIFINTESNPLLPRQGGGSEVTEGSGVDLTRSRWPASPAL